MTFSLILFSFADIQRIDMNDLFDESVRNFAISMIHLESTRTIGIYLLLLFDKIMADNSLSRHKNIICLKSMLLSIILQLHAWRNM